MELRHLRYFVGVAEESSFTRAARKLRVAQPALSRQIRQLEEEMGVALFERDRTGARLTEAGRVFLGEARSLLTHSASAVKAAQAARAPGGGSLNIGYIWALFHTIAPAAIARFRREFPGVAVHLFDLTGTQQAEGLMEGRLDAGFVGFAHEADAPGLAKRKVGECELVAALPENHPAAKRRTVPLAALAQDFFFAISDQTYPGAARWVMDACAGAGFRPKILQAAERGYTILGLVAGNCGVALLPEPLRALPHPGVVFRPLTPPPKCDLFVAWKAGRMTPLREAFVRSLSESLGTV
jgi:DNA-binding transcriptional LysR family regulator